MSDGKLNDSEWEAIRKQRPVRLRIGGESFYWFFHLYYPHYISHATAPFQKQIMDAASDPDLEHLVVMAFRESGKSTIITTAFPLWAITGVLKKKYIVIVSQTQNQAQQHLKNIAGELESNELLRKDFWPYEAEENESGVSSIALPKFGAKIIAISREQGVRGLRHGPHRPDLIIADDVEDSNSVKTKEGRAKTYDWFTGELLPLGTEHTKFITVGNLLHDDSLLMRLKAGIANKTRNGRFMEFPIVVDDKPLWAARFEDMTAIGKLKSRIDNRVTWEREYMLRLVPDDDQIITRQMIHTYPELPTLLRGQYHRIVIGVDLAISENDKADCTAIVTLEIRGTGSKLRIYVHPHPFNKRISFPKTTDLLREMNATHYQPKLYIEQTAYQAAVVQELKQDGLDVTGVTPRADKRSRLNMIASKIERGMILFPKRGCEELINQLIGFGVEKHDDLVDALTTAILEYMREDQSTGSMVIMRNSDFWKRQPNRVLRGRSYWNRRLDDWEEATSSDWD
ncbi:MAG TPA: phage terminase large subunit [Candidatus Saccharimonadales bacterium]|nr:phage terminase large subunit [Candidatus Saccharimonadales bacterium]